MDVIKLKSVTDDRECSLEQEIAECINDLCLLNKGLMKEAGKDDMLDGIGIGLCTAVTVLAKGIDGLPIFSKNREEVIKMLKIGDMLLSAYDEEKSEEKPEEEKKEDAGESSEHTEEEIDELIKMLEKTFDTIDELAKSIRGKHD